MNEAIESMSSHKLQVLYCRRLIRKYSAAKLEQETRSSCLSNFSWQGSNCLVIECSHCNSVCLNHYITITGVGICTEDSESRNFCLLFVIMNPFEKLRRTENFTSSFMSYQLLQKSMHKLQLNCHGPHY